MRGWKIATKRDERTFGPSASTGAMRRSAGRGDRFQCQAGRLKRDGYRGQELDQVPLTD
jgi:hypothetical protein